MPLGNYLIDSREGAHVRYRPHDKSAMECRNIMHVRYTDTLGIILEFLFITTTYIFNPKFSMSSIFIKVNDLFVVRSSIIANWHHH